MWALEGAWRRPEHEQSWTAGRQIESGTRRGCGGPTGLLSRRGHAVKGCAGRERAKLGRGICQATSDRVAWLIALHSSEHKGPSAACR
jgi:hypothetical protein